MQGRAVARTSCLQIMQQLPPMEKHIKLNTTISMSSYPLATGSSHIVAHNSAFGRHSDCGNILSRASRWMMSVSSRRAAAIILTSCWLASVTSGHRNKVFWRKVLDIYATSIDYDPDMAASQLFFATVQNKMHWAAHGHTAAEVIAERADATKPNMGMAAWIGSPTKIRRDSGEELPDSGGTGVAESYRIGISGDSPNCRHTTASRCI